MPLAIGSRVGPYEILSPLGAGGMGEVYRARDGTLGRDVAIKILPDAFTNHPDRLARFEREARVLASLNHPHIGAIYGLEAFDSGRGLVLELVPGPTLADRLAQGPLPLTEALAIARQMADALEAAHEKGIVHRDLKPANIKITPDDVVKVLDFGLAKADRDASGAELTNSPTMFVAATGEGMLLGTAPYMSPEQARGRPIDKRTDIWAFGCVLYELLTGRPAFKGETSADSIAAILEREPDWSALPATTPASIRRLLQRCIEKDPKRRVHDIADARIEIDDVLTIGSSSIVQAPANASGTGPHRPPMLAWFLAALFLAVSGITLAVLWFRAPATQPARVARLFLPPSEGTKYVASPIVGGPISVSPDGRRLAFAAVGDDGVQRLWVRAFDTAVATALAGTERASFPFWSPDSRAIGFFVPGHLKRIDASGGSLLELCEAITGRGGAWNEEGVIVFAPAVRAGLSRVSDRGGVPTPLAGIEPTAHYPAFLPDGRHFLYNLGPALGTGSAEGTQLGTYVGSLDGADRPFLIAESSNVAYASPGYLVYVKNRTLQAQPFDAKGLRVTGPAIQMADSVAYMDGPKLGNFAVSDTALAFFGVGLQDRARLEFVDRAGKPVSTVGDPDAYNELRLSPDDQHVAFVRQDPQGTDQIWVLDVRSGTPTPLTDGPIFEGSPIWSGTSRIVFSRNGGLGGLSQIDNIGVGGIQSVIAESAVGRAPYDVSRDGAFILFGLAQDQNRFELWALPTGGAKPFRIPGVPADQREAQLSRDGQWLAYVSNESGSARVYVQRFSEQPADAGEKCPVALGQQPKWGTDGRELFYVAGGSLMSVEIQRGPTCAVGPPRTLFALGADTRSASGTPHRYGVTADGQRFLISRTTKEAVPTPLTVILNWTAGLKKSN
jgi:Tol biopolymer transport system component